MKKLPVVYFFNAFDSYMLDDAEVASSGLVQRLLGTNQHVKVSARLSVKFVVSSNDVLHSFSLLQVGMKVDAVPGRINAMTIFLLQPNIVRGQCSELCGAGHYGMPIVVEAGRRDVFFGAMTFDFFRSSFSSTHCALTEFGSNLTENN